MLNFEQKDYNGPFILWAAEPDQLEESSDNGLEEE